MPGDLADVLGSADRAAITAKLKELEARADAIDREIALRREFLAMLDRWEGDDGTEVEVEGEGSVPSSPAATVPEAVTAPTRPKPTTSPEQRREAILSILRRQPHAEWSMESIRSALDEMEFDFEGGTPLKGHLFRMVEKGLIERPRLRFYTLPASERQNGRVPEERMAL